MQPLSSPWDSIQQFGHCLFKLPKNTAGFGPDAGKASVTGMQQGQMLRHSSDHTGSGFYHLSSQQAAALPGSSPVNNLSGDYLQFLTTGCGKSTGRSFFQTSMQEGPLLLPKGTRLSTSTTGFLLILQSWVSIRAALPSSGC